MQGVFSAAMGIIFNRRKKVGKGTTLNVSKRSASVSKRVCPLTVNSRGRASVRLGKGLRFKI